MCIRDSLQLSSSPSLQAAKDPLQPPAGGQLGQATAGDAVAGYGSVAPASALRAVPVLVRRVLPPRRSRSRSRGGGG
eukprot:3307195-Alexandrium_andersonii.AAC.1